MKTLIAFLFSAALCLAQYAPIPSSSYSALDAILNAKLTFTTQAGAPSGNCSLGKDINTNSSNGDIYFCTALNTWTKIYPIAGGGSIASTVQLLQGNGSGSAIASGITWDGTTFTLPGLLVLNPSGSLASLLGYSAGTQSFTGVPANSNGIMGRATITGQHYVLLPGTGATAAKQVLASTGAESGGLTDLAYTQVGSAANNILQLDNSARLPAVDASQLTNVPAGISRLIGYEVGAESATAAFVTADLTNHGIAINGPVSKTLVEASCIADTGSPGQVITAKIGATTLFSITCVAYGSYSRGTTTGSTGYIVAGSMGSTAIAAGAKIDLSGTADGTTKDVKLTGWVQ